MFNQNNLLEDEFIWEEISKIDDNSIIIDYSDTDCPFTVDDKLYADVEQKNEINSKILSTYNRLKKIVIIMK